MIEQISLYRTFSTNPYDNIALEEYFLHHVEDNEVLLYLWQNDRTVVIGRNQNARAECKVEALTRGGGHLARRLSGGGAVYHDLGNLNFTFLAQESNYNVDRQLQVILRAVQTLGIDAVKSGRNDLTVDGRKFSGNAFYKSSKHCYHHGTLLLHSDMGQLGQYLNPDREKLQTHGVESVRARVGNLSEWNPAVTVDSMAKALWEAMAEVYEQSAAFLSESRLCPETIGKLREKYASTTWLLGAERPYTVQMKKRFSWGSGELCLRISGGSVMETAFYTDALEVELAELIMKAFTGVAFEKQALLEAAKRLPEVVARDVGLLAAALLE